MELQKQLTSLELSKRLKELGMPQESLFYWLEYDSPAAGGGFELGDHAPYKGQEGFAAYTVAELDELLPKAIIRNEIFSIGHRCIFAPNIPEQLHTVLESNGAEARGLMIEYLLTNNLLSL